MKYICVTHVDSITRTPCTDAPMPNGPDYPALDRLVIEWSNQSEYPTNNPKFYGYCDDAADLQTAGVIEVLSKKDYDQKRRDEMYARKPYPSWQFDENTLEWFAPVPKPWEGDEWDEDKGEWVITEQSAVCRVEYYKQRLIETDYVALPDYDKDKPEVIAQRAEWRAEIRDVQAWLEQNKEE